MNTEPEKNVEQEVTAVEAVTAEPALDDEVALDGEVEAEVEPDDVAEAEAVAEDEPDYHDLYLRAAAEIENVRKRARRDVAAAETRGIVRLATQLLPAVDNLDRALAAAEAEEGDSDHHLTQGIRLVQQELIQSLVRVGIKSQSPLGEPFDPHRHEAVSQTAVEGTAPGIVVEVYQPGYTYEDTVLRAAKVVVSA